MVFKQVLAALAVADMDRAVAWYGRLFGRPCDSRPMAEAAEWRLLDGGGVQLVLDPERAGQSMATIGLDDVAAWGAQLRARGLVGKVDPPGRGPFRLARLADPDGNILTFAEAQGAV